MNPCTFRSQPSKFFLKKNSYIFLYFRKWKPTPFSLSSRNKKDLPGEYFLYFRKRKCQKENFSKESCPYVLGNREPAKIFIFQETEATEKLLIF